MSQNKSETKVETVAHTKKNGGFLSWLKSCFFTGIFSMAPVLITFLLIRFTVRLLDGAATSIFPKKYAPSNYLPYDIPGFEILLGFVLIVILGAFVRNYIGAKLLRWGEGIMLSIPGVKTIYSSVKQVIDTVSTSNSASFREVVLVEYPRKGIWAMGFVSGKTQGEIQRMTEDEMLNVFLPTTPNPTSGFLLFVPKKEIRPLHMTVDQGIKMLISAGIVTPTSAEGYDALHKEQQEDNKKREHLVVDKLSTQDVEEAKKRTADRLKNQG